MYSHLSLCLILCVLLYGACKNKPDSPRQKDYDAIGKIKKTMLTPQGICLYSDYTNYIESADPDRDNEDYTSSYLTHFDFLDEGGVRVSTRKEMRCTQEKPCMGPSGLFGTHSGKVLGNGKLYIAVECHCSKKLSVYSLLSGDEVLDSQGAGSLPGLSAGIAHFSASPIFSGQGVLEITTKDGSNFLLSLDDLSLNPKKNVGNSASKNKSEASELPFEGYVFDNEPGSQRWHFYNKKLSKKPPLKVTRTKLSEQAWFAPKFVEGYGAEYRNMGEYLNLSPGSDFWVMHCKEWSPKQERDMLSKIDLQGNVLQSLPLDSLGSERLSMHIRGNWLYTVTPSHISVLDLSQGSIKARYGYAELMLKK